MVLLNRDTIIELARECGFDLVGVVQSSPVDKSYSDTLYSYIDKGYHASMEWMGNNLDKRVDPSKLVEEAKSIIVCAIAYLPYNKYQYIAKYSYGNDYHYVLKGMFNKLYDKIEAIYGVRPNGQICVDSAPFAERYWAVKAGIGWIGKNGMVINKKYGSYLVLGELIIDAEFDSYSSQCEKECVENCGRCVKSCPTSAINSDGIIDAHKCLSYLTIEHKGEFVPSQIKDMSLSNNILGCDICQDCCPWNNIRTNSITVEEINKINSIFAIDNYIYPSSYDEWNDMGSSEFKRRFSSSPIMRAGLKKLKRNINTKR